MAANEQMETGEEGRGAGNWGAEGRWDEDWENEAREQVGSRVYSAEGGSR